MTINASLTSFVPQVSQWQLQSEHNVYDTLGKDWCLHDFWCVMKDGSQTRLFGNYDEGGVNYWFEDEDKDYDLEDIVYWLEVPYPPSTDLLDLFSKKEWRINYYEDQSNHRRQ